MFLNCAMAYTFFKKGKHILLELLGIMQCICGINTFQLSSNNKDFACNTPIPFTDFTSQDSLLLVKLTNAIVGD